MADDVTIWCNECDPPTEWRPAQLAGHQNKHRRERAREALANDSSSIPTESKVNQAGEVADEATTGYVPPTVTPVVVHRPKVADALIPWLSIAGLAVHRRNEYDGTVISQGIPGFIGALDDVAQGNDSLYRLLEGIKKGDSPNFRLALATIAIVVPIMANHRPDSGALRNLVGGLRIMPGTNIPALPKPTNVSQEVHDANESLVTKMHDTLASMSDEEQEQLADAFSQLPPDLIDKMVQFQTAPSMMAHPEASEAVDDATPPE